MAVVETFFFVAILIINYRIFKIFKTRFVENDKKEKDDKNLILSNSIKPKKMFYNEKETGEIQKLVSLLSNENYCKIQERLGKKRLEEWLYLSFHRRARHWKDRDSLSDCPPNRTQYNGGEYSRNKKHVFW